MPRPPCLDPRLGDWIFDSTVLNCFWKGGVDQSFIATFTGRTHLADEVVREISVPPVSGASSASGWFHTHELTLGPHTQGYARLRQAWGSAPYADRGEAASIVLASANKWIFVTDDGVAYHTAQRLGLCVTRSPQVLAGLVRMGRLSASQAWKAWLQMQARGQRFGRTVPWSNNVEFAQYCSIQSFERCHRSHPSRSAPLAPELPEAPA